MKIERLAYLLIFMAVVGTFVFFAGTSYPGFVPEAATKAEAVATDGPMQSKKLVFSDEFDGTALDQQNWATCYDWRKASETGCTNHGNFEQQWYLDSQVGLGDGNLVLTAIKSPIDVSVGGEAKHFEYRSGMINSGKGSSSRARWVGTYGYYEARMYVQKGQGVWPAFWLLPADGEWPPEIDIMEFLGHKQGEILQTVHWDNDGKTAKSDSVISGNPDYSADWHTYGVDWQPGKIEWYIDGVKTKTFTGSEVPSEPMEIIVNLAIGGLLPGNADTSTPFPRELKVDYVRVYQASDQIRPSYQ